MDDEINFIYKHCKQTSTKSAFIFIHQRRYLLWNQSHQKYHDATGVQQSTHISEAANTRESIAVPEGGHAEKDGGNGGEEF